MCGLAKPPHFGRVVQLQGLLCVLATLALLGRAAARLGAGDAGIALAVVLVGTCWPIWLVSRHGGAEPDVMLLIAGFATVEAPALRIATLVALPWIHPTGFVLAPILAAASCWGEPDRSRGLRFLAAKTLAFAAAGLVMSLAISTVVVCRRSSVCVM